MLICPTLHAMPFFVLRSLIPRRRGRVAHWVALSVWIGLSGAVAQAQDQIQAPVPPPPAEGAPPQNDEAANAGEQAPAFANNGIGGANNGVPGTKAFDQVQRDAPLFGAYSAGPRGGPDRERVTPQQRRAASEARMRDVMARMGIASVATQDAIFSFLSADEDGKREVREAGRKLMNGVRRQAPPERLKALLSDYQNVLNANRQRRERAQTALDAQVGFSLDARLESALWLLGVLGQGQSAIGPNAFGPNNAPPMRRAEGDASMSSLAATVGATSGEIAGVVNAKSGPDEAEAWLEIRDASGHLWRLKPDSAPEARKILSRQIEAIPVGAQIVARVTSPVPVPVLLAIVPDSTNRYPLLTPYPLLSP